MTDSARHPGLVELAAACGVATEYWDQAGNQILAWSIPSITVTASGNNLVQIPAGGLTITAGPAWAADLTLTGGRLAYLTNNEPQRH